MKPAKTSSFYNHKITVLLFSLLILPLAMNGCTSTPAASTEAPTLDTTALVSQIAQTLEAKYTQQAAQNPTLEAVSTLLPTAVPLTLAPTPTLPPAQSALLLPTLTPTATPGSSGIKPATGAAAPPALFAVIHVISGVNHADISTTCPSGYTFNFTASISTNGPGTVTYYWEFSDNTKTDIQTLTFDSASTQTVSSSWELGKDGKTPGSNPYKGWARITIVKPNNQVFTRASFNFECK